jgi:phage terminase large subunit-like protein
VKSPKWTTACPGWGERIKSGRSIIPQPIFPEQAEQALKIFKALRIVDAPGSPTFGEACAEWVFDIVRSIFGAYDPVSGRRLITEWFILIPKKNSKSTLAAGVMMTALILNWRKSAEFAIIAPTVEVASNSYAPCGDMCAKDDELKDLMQVQTHYKTITNRDSNAFLKVLAADNNTVGGKKSVGTLIEELHLFGKMHGAENMLREALGGLASRPEGFVIYLTTQSDEPPAGVFKQKLQYARDVRDGVIVDPRFLPIIFEHPPDMVKSREHLLEKNLAMVNPNLGYSVDPEFLSREYKKAKESGEVSFIGFMSKYANIEIGLALRSDRWAGADFWETSAEDGLTFAEILRRSEVIDIGIDGGGLDDLLGMAIIGRCEKTRRWLLWTRAWAHQSVLDRRKEVAPRLLDFAKDGDLVMVKQIGDDVTEVAGIVAEIDQAGLLDKVGVDPIGIGAILDAMVDAKIDQEKVVGVSQGWRLGGAIKTMERKLAEGGLSHSVQDMMRWCVGNAKVEPKGNAILITKQASGSAKIDPLMASFNAISLMSLNPAAARKKHEMFFM